MTTSEILQLTGSVASILVSICALIVTIKSNKFAKKIDATNIELQIRSLITTAKMNYLNNLDKKKRKMSLIEDLINAYDEACSKVLKGTFDLDSFSNIYKNEIYGLFKCKITKDIINNEHNSYQSIIKVYKILIKKN